jgi:hypothetical protein
VFALRREPNFLEVSGWARGMAVIWAGRLKVLEVPVLSQELNG